MEVYEIRPLEDRRCVLTGPLGIVDRLEIDSAREAALHAQFCAGGRPSTLRVYRADGTLDSERPIPPRKRTVDHQGFGMKPTTYF